MRPEESCHFASHRESSVRRVTGRSRVPGRASGCRIPDPFYHVPWRMAHAYPIQLPYSRVYLVSGLRRAPLSPALMCPAVVISGTDTDTHSLESGCGVYPRTRVGHTVRSVTVCGDRASAGSGRAGKTKGARAPRDPPDDAMRPPGRSLLGRRAAFAIRKKAKKGRPRRTGPQHPFFVDCMRDAGHSPPDTRAHRTAHRGHAAHKIKHTHRERPHTNL